MPEEQLATCARRRAGTDTTPFPAGGVRSASPMHRGYLISYGLHALKTELCRRGCCGMAQLRTRLRNLDRDIEEHGAQ